MSAFLRDQFIKNVTIDEITLGRISDFFIRKSQSTGFAEDAQPTLLSYTIRFDNRGYKLTQFKDVLRLYSEAKHVERIIFTLESQRSLQTTRAEGTCVELKLDKTQDNACYLVVSADDEEWVDHTFDSIIEIVRDATNYHALLRGPWTSFFVQVSGVIFGFFICLWITTLLAPHLKAEDSFSISFIFVFIIYANVWTIINQQTLKLINYIFPNILFKRKNRDNLHWVLQTILGGVIVAIVIFILGHALSYVTKIASGFIK